MIIIGGFILVVIRSVFSTDDDTDKYISNMALNLTPYSIAIGKKNI